MTQQDALEAIDVAEEIIRVMKEDNFSAEFVEDSLFEARRVFEQARNADILRNSSSSSAQKRLALSSLGLADWKTIDY